MSDPSKTFTLSNLASEHAVVESDSPSGERPYELSELVMDKPSIRRGFTYDSENARNFDQSNVSKAKVGVKELLKDAVEKAKRQAVEIKAYAKKEGHDLGYEEGFKKGEAAAREEFKPFLETIEGLISDLSGFRKNMYDKVEREMIEMVVSLAKKVIHFEFSTRDDAVQEMIRLAVQSVLDRESMVIKINPADKGYAESFRPELHHLFGEIKNIIFEAHSGVERGGCVVESNFGVIDARIEKLEEQMDRILNLAPLAPEELAAAAEVQLEPMKEEGSEIPTAEETQTEESDTETGSPEETPIEESDTKDDSPKETPPEESDTETDSPEETS